MSDIILIGASTRAAAMSALRAGLTPWCADLFADADLQRIATVRKVPLEAYPHGLLDALADAPRAPVLYTGALENRPDLVGRIDRPLWGNGPEVLRAVRSPLRWAQSLRANGLPCPALAHQPKATGRWLLKPQKSAGGLGIRFYDGQPFNPHTHFLQEWIDGSPCSAVFLGSYDGAMLLGVTAQLVGVSWLHATGFHYAGNIGPLPLDSAAETCWSALGNELAKAFRLRGLFGVDAILRDGVPWPIEINPRYTASVEVVERSLQLPSLLWHREVFEQRPLSALKRCRTPTTWGKGILYARQAFVFPADGPWQGALETGADLDAVEYGDIPQVGAIIEQGQPVLTLFASGATAEACRAKLRENAGALDRRLWG